MCVLGVADVLLMAEHFVDNLQLPRTSIRLVHPRASYRQMTREITQGQLNMSGFKIVVSLIRHADILNRTVPVETSVLQLREAFDLVNPAVILLMGTPLPWPGDQPQVVRKMFRTTTKLKTLCNGRPTLEFLCATQEFVTLNGINPVYMDSHGLTLAARTVLVRLINGKIDCGRL